MEGKLRERTQLDKLLYTVVLTLPGSSLMNMESALDVLSLRPPLVNIEQRVRASDLTPAIDCWSEERPRLGEKYLAEHQVWR